MKITNVPVGTQIKIYLKSDIHKEIKGEFLGRNADSFALYIQSSESMELFSFKDLHRYLILPAEEQEDFSVMSKVRYHNNILRAIDSRTKIDINTREFDWGKACDHYRLAITDGCVDDDIISRYLEYNRKFICNPRLVDNVRRRMEAYRRFIDDFLCNPDIRWSRCSRFGIKSVLVEIFRMRAYAGLHDRNADLNPLINAIIGDLLTDGSVCSAANLRRPELYLDRDAYQTHLVALQTLALTGHLNPAALCQNLEKLTDSLKSRDAAPDLNAGNEKRSWADDTRELCSLIEEVITHIKNAKSSRGDISPVDNLFQLTLNDAESKKNLSNQDPARYLKNQENAIARYYNLLETLHYYADELPQEKRKNFLKRNYWYLVATLCRQYPVRVSVYQRLRPGQTEFIERQKKKYSQSLVQYLPDAGGFAVLGGRRIETGYADARNYYLNDIGECLRILGMDDELAMLRRAFAAKVENQLKDGLKFVTEARESSQLGDKTVKCKLVDVLDDMRFLRSEWLGLDRDYAVRMFLKQFERLYSSVDTLFADILYWLLLLAGSGKTPLILRNLGLAESKELSRWLADGIIRTDNQTPEVLSGFSQSGLADFCCELLQNSFLDREQKLQLVAIGHRANNLSGCRDEEGKILSKWEKLLVSELDRLREKHNPLATAAFYSLFVGRGGLKFLLHAGLEEGKNKFCDQLSDIFATYTSSVKQLFDDELPTPSGFYDRMSAYLFGCNSDGSSPAEWSDIDGADHGENLSSPEWTERILALGTNPLDTNNMPGDFYNGIPAKFKRSIKTEGREDFRQMIISAMESFLLSDDSGAGNFARELCPTIDVEVVGDCSFYHGGILPELVRKFISDSIGLGPKGMKLKISLQSDMSGGSLLRKYIIRMTNITGRDSDIKWEEIQSGLKGDTGTFAAMCAGYCDFAVVANVEGRGRRYNILNSNPFDKDDIIGLDSPADGHTLIFTFYQFTKNLFDESMRLKLSKINSGLDPSTVSNMVACLRNQKSIWK